MASETSKARNEDDGANSDDGEDYVPYIPLKQRRQEQLARLGVKRQKTSVKEIETDEEKVSESFQN